MMPYELWQMLVALPIGAGLGLIFFGGLWLTVARIPSSRRPHLLLAGSFLLRMTVVLSGFYLLAPLGWQAMTIAMAGLLITRQVLLRIKGRPQCDPAA
jgi:F1F0 ATPase subunit 2